jgi:D-amino peptidase
MKLFLSCDMEGATGLVSFSQVMPKNSEYPLGRAMQLHDVRALVETALEWGVERIILNDAHGSMRNLDLRDFPDSEKLELCSGSSKILGMVEGVQECDVAFFVAYHAMAGTEKAVMDHTMGFSPFEVRLNRQLVGETGLNAAACGALGVPVALISGDYAVCCEARSLLGQGITCCDVKEGCGARAARLLGPEQTKVLLQKAAREALDKAAAGKIFPFEVSLPCQGSVTFCETRQCDRASIVPGSERVSGRTLVGTFESVLDFYRWQASVIALGESA